MKRTLTAFITIVATGIAAFAAVPYDFDGDGRSDFAITHLQPNPGTNGSGIIWYIARSGTGIIQNQAWGIFSPDQYDLVRAADYDGDGRTDIAVQRIVQNQSTTTFYILNSSDNTARVENFGRQTDDSKVIGDYDGDGRADLCVYGYYGKNYGYLYKGSRNNPAGTTTFVPLNRRAGTAYPGDFDGDGKFDFSVRYTFTTSPPVFTIKRSTDGIFENVNWGVSSDELAPGDYDGDGRTDFCVRRSNGTNYLWYILERDGGGTGASPISFGLADANTRLDLPFGGADFDGDRKSDIGVYVSSGSEIGTFFVRRSGDGGLITYSLGLGTENGDTPVYNTDREAPQIPVQAPGM